MPRSEKYFIGPQLLGDIRQTVSRVSAMPQGSRIGKIPTRLQDLPRGGGSLRFVSWTQTWNASATATLTFKGGTQTATAVNTFAGVGPGDGWVARHEGTWHLASVNLTMQPNYQADQIQLIGHGDDGILNWYSVTQCGTTAA